jgi:hypothetical protein
METRLRNGDGLRAVVARDLAQVAAGVTPPGAFAFSTGST